MPSCGRLLPASGPQLPSPTAGSPLCSLSLLPAIFILPTGPRVLGRSQRTPLPQDSSHTAGPQWWACCAAVLCRAAAQCCAVLPRSGMARPAVLPCTACLPRHPPTHPPACPNATPNPHPMHSPHARGLLCAAASRHRHQGRRGGRRCPAQLLLPAACGLCAAATALSCALTPTPLTLSRPSLTPSMQMHTDYVNFVQTTHLGLVVPEGDCWMKVRWGEAGRRQGQALAALGLRMQAQRACAGGGSWPQPWRPRRTASRQTRQLQRQAPGAPCAACTLSHLCPRARARATRRWASTRGTGRWAR